MSNTPNLEFFLENDYIAENSPESLVVNLDGKEKLLYPGDTCLILPGVWHSFSTKTGCIFEEISTTHYNNDSVYRDKMINNLNVNRYKVLL
mgnify:CR=1 FL=1